MTFGQWLAHLEEASPSAPGVFWGVLAIVALDLVLVAAWGWWQRRGWPVCAACQERVHPDELHWCGE